jgi:signal peptidase I
MNKNCLSSEEALLLKKINLGYIINTDTYSSSMIPIIKSKSSLQIQKMKFEDINLGDIIVYLSNKQNKLVAHRVVTIKEESNQDIIIQTKGDNNPFIDKHPTCMEQYIGTVIKINNYPIKFKENIQTLKNLVRKVIFYKLKIKNFFGYTP